ncbi:IS110 family transposase [Streptomyces sp. NBC_01136]|uniref:hypothetical protein n=1 Tax=unclassified Streptomyces TaxID=2593676 RepID=UPI00325687B9|nr:IS110 family transposase [Streptomyces sp. NBC_01136]
MTHDGTQITGGVDTHGLAHHAAVIDMDGRHLADLEFPATIHGYRDLLDWMRSHGTLVAVGAQCTEEAVPPLVGDLARPGLGDLGVVANPAFGLEGVQWVVVSVRAAAPAVERDRVDQRG